MCFKIAAIENNPIRDRINSWLLHILDDYMHLLYRRRKQYLFRDLPPTVIEIGAGSGANMRYLKTGAKLTAIEPNKYMHKRLKDKANRYKIDIDIVNDRAEKIALEDNSVDVVISTLTLCTIANELAALTEIKRILKPQGRFVFIEHVGARKGTLLRKLQELIHKPWFWFFEGCHTHKDLASSIENAGFSKVGIERFNCYSPFLPLTSQISGYAIK